MVTDASNPARGFGGGRGREADRPAERSALRRRQVVGEAPNQRVGRGIHRHHGSRRRGTDDQSLGQRWRRAGQTPQSVEGHVGPGPGHGLRPRQPPAGGFQLAEQDLPLDFGQHVEPWAVGHGDAEEHRTGQFRLVLAAGPAHGPTELPLPLQIQGQQAARRRRQPRGPADVERGAGQHGAAAGAVHGEGQIVQQVDPLTVAAELAPGDVVVHPLLDFRRQVDDERPRRRLLDRRLPGILPDPAAALPVHGPKPLGSPQQDQVADDQRMQGRRGGLRRIVNTTHGHRAG